MKEFINLPEESLLPMIYLKMQTGHLDILYNNSEKQIKIIIKDKFGKITLEDLYLQLDMIANYYQIDYNPKQVNFKIKEKEKITTITASFF